MRLFNFKLVYILLQLCSCSVRESISISGRVTNFDKSPLDSVSVELKNKNFGTIYSALTDSNGRYSFTVKKGNYFALCAVKKNEYARSKLAFRAWNIPAYKDLTIDILNDKLEVSGMNVSMLQGDPPTYTIYLRTVSLTRYVNYIGEKNPLSTIAPNIDSVDFNVSIDGEALKILSVIKVNEYIARDCVTGFLIQTEFKKPKDMYSAIEVNLYDRELKECGEAKCYFVKD
jgi:hypothetical protein